MRMALVDHNFCALQLVHIDVGTAMITSITRETLAYTSDQNQPLPASVVALIYIVVCPGRGPARIEGKTGPPVR